MVHIISIDKVDYDYGDKRTTGFLEVEATISNGSILKLSGMVDSSGGLFDETVNIDGKTIECDLEIEVPHYYTGVKACKKWNDNKVENLTRDLNDWLSDHMSLESLATPIEVVLKNPPKVHFEFDS